MRCKNCGSENDDNLYICQNCGSPLYDEDDGINEQNNETQVFHAIVDEDGQPASRNGNKTDISNDDKDKKKKQQTIAIIIILAVILLAIIIGVIVAVANHSKQEDTTAPTTESTTISTTREITTEATTRQTTTKATTTESTTKTTTTTTTTEATTFTVTLSCNDGGEVNGDGTYKRGENVTVVAKPADGYAFDGWYKGSSKVSSNTKYTFTVTGDASLEAVFVLVNEEVEVLDGGTD